MRDNKEKVKLRHKFYRNTNLLYFKGIRGSERAKSLSRIPKWVSEQEMTAIQLFYTNCPPGKVVDYIIPLRGDNVSGLHVLDNLQYLTMSENSSKQSLFDGTLTNNSWRLRYNSKRSA